MSELIRVRHTVSGQISDEPVEIVEHAHFSRYLERVDADAKPYVAEMHIPRVAEDSTITKNKPHTEGKEGSGA